MLVGLGLEIQSLIDLGNALEDQYSQRSNFLPSPTTQRFQNHPDQYLRNPISQSDSVYLIHANRQHPLVSAFLFHIVSRHHLTTTTTYYTSYHRQLVFLLTMESHDVIRYSVPVTHRQYVVDQ